MNKELKIPIIITIVYAILTLIAVLHHEIWADEAQVWLLCKNLSISELFHHLHNEGHPFFIYLLVMPFAKLTSNIIYMQLVCWFFMVGSIFLLFRYSPFHFITKISITLSAGFIYFLPVIARDYSLLPFLMFLGAILYSKQKQHPVLYAIFISLITCTNIIMFCFSFCLFLLFVHENLIKNLDRKKYITPAFIFILSFAYVIWQLGDTIKSNIYINANIVPSELYNNTIFVITSIFKNTYNYIFFTANNNQLLYPIFDIPMIIIFVVLFLMLFAVLFLNNKKFFFFAMLSICFQLGIYCIYFPVCIYPIRIFIAFTILVFTLWILINSQELTTNTKKYINIILSIFFIITSYNGINFYIQDIKYPYSDAINTAEFIKKNIDINSVILYSNELYMADLLYYMGNNEHNFISVIRKEPFKYIIWDNKSLYHYQPEEWQIIVENYIEYLITLIFRLLSH